MIPEVPYQLTDWINWLAFPATATFLAFVLWRLLLWNAYPKIGWRPLAIAYLLFVAALLALSAVPPLRFIGGPVFAFVLFFDIAVIAISIGVPVAALLVRSNRLNYATAAALVFLYVVAAALTFGKPDTDWELANPIANFMDSLFGFAVVVVPATSAFFFGLTSLIRRRQRREDGSGDRQQSLLGPAGSLNRTAGSPPLPSGAPPMPPWYTPAPGQD